MSHVELLEAQGNPLGLVLAILLVTALCVTWVVLVQAHRAGMRRVRADTGGKLRPTARALWLMRRHVEHELDDDERGTTAWQPSAEQ